MIVLWQINRLAFGNIPRADGACWESSQNPTCTVPTYRQLRKILWVVQECDVSRLWWFMSANAYWVHCVHSTGSKLYLHFIVTIHLFVNRKINVSSLAQWAWLILLVNVPGIIADDISQCVKIQSSLKETVFTLMYYITVLQKNHKSIFQSFMWLVYFKSAEVMWCKSHLH